MLNFNVKIGFYFFYWFNFYFYKELINYKFSLFFYIVYKYLLYILCNIRKNVFVKKMYIEKVLFYVFIDLFV